MVYLIVFLFCILIFGLLGIFVPVYFQGKNLKKEEILEILKEEYIKSGPYTTDQDKRRKEMAKMRGSELIAKVKNELEGYMDRRKEGGHDLTRYELKHERRLNDILLRYRNA